MAPFVELLSDTKQLYKLSVKIMTKIHRTLPHESLCRLRKVFTDIFNGLHSFYGAVGRMAYFTQWDLTSTLPTSEPVFVSANRAFIYTEDTGTFASIELRPSQQPPPYREADLINLECEVPEETTAVDKVSSIDKDESRVAVIQPLSSNEEDKVDSVEPKTYDITVVMKKQEKKPEGVSTLIRKKDKKIRELEFQNERLFSYYNKEVDRMRAALTDVQCELVEVKTELKACHEEL